MRFDEPTILEIQKKKKKMAWKKENILEDWEIALVRPVHKRASISQHDISDIIHHIRF